MSLLACASERGKAWDRPAPSPAAPELSLLLIGEAGFPGRTAGRTAAELERTLAARRRAGVPVILLWLGDVLGDEAVVVRVELDGPGRRRPPAAALHRRLPPTDAQHLQLRQLGPALDVRGR